MPKNATGEKPTKAPRVETRYRRVVTTIPVPESLSVLKAMQKYEPRAMGTQIPVVWDRAEGFQVYDAYGNCWIDFTSGIVVANSGHAHSHVCRALSKQIDQKLLHAYLFPTKIRARLVEKLVEISPANLTKVALFSTGSEAMECAIKLSRLYGMRIRSDKTVLVSFTGAFHGRTMGAQMLCSAQDHKRWITNPDPDIHQIPFPRCCQCPWKRDSYEGCGEECFQKSLKLLQEKGVDLERIAAFFMEGYQGVRGPIFYPDDYMQALRKWANDRQSLMVVDEIQSGFGRTGKLFAYQHYGVEADLVCCGKGMSSSLPFSAVLGPAEILDIPDPGYMTSTHSGNPVCCAATLASIEVLEKENLIAAAAEKGRLLEKELLKIKNHYADRISMVTGRGLVYGLFFIRPGTEEPDIELANRVVAKSIQQGLLLFITGNGSIKICPPLVISEDALVEGVGVISEAVRKCLSGEVS